MGSFAAAGTDISTAMSDAATALTSAAEAQAIEVLRQNGINVSDTSGTEHHS